MRCTTLDASSLACFHHLPGHSRPTLCCFAPCERCSGLEDLQWRSDNIDAFIKDAVELVRDLDSVLSTLKDNVRRTQVGPADTLECSKGASLGETVFSLSAVIYASRSRAHSLTFWKEVRTTHALCWLKHVRRRSCAPSSAT